MKAHLLAGSTLLRNFHKSCRILSEILVPRDERQKLHKNAEVKLRLQSGPGAGLWPGLDIVKIVVMVKVIDRR